MWTARSAPRPVSPPPTTRATRSTRPRSSIGAAVRIAWRNPERSRAPAAPFTSEVNVNMDNEKKCPFPHNAHGGPSNRDWWPNQLNLNVLHRNPPKGDPMGADFNYAEAFKSLDLDALKKDLVQVMTTSQEW